MIKGGKKSSFVILDKHCFTSLFEQSFLEKSKTCDGTLKSVSPIHFVKNRLYFF